MKFYFVYILKCADQSYYTGVTNNLEKRLAEHSTGYGASAYTSTRLPVELVFSQQCSDIVQAIALEKQIKGWTRRKKEAFISENWSLLKKMSKNYSQFGSLEIKSPDDPQMKSQNETGNLTSSP